MRMNPSAVVALLVCIAVLLFTVPSLAADAGENVLPSAERQGMTNHQQSPQGVELTIRNEEQSPARVALAYMQADKLVVEGWFTFSPDQVERITLNGVGEKDVFIHVEFADPTLEQFFDHTWTVLGPVAKGPFRYATDLVDGTWMPKESALREVIFHAVDMMNRTGKGKLWFNLSTAAG